MPGEPTIAIGLRAAWATAPDCKSGVSDIRGSNPRQSTNFPRASRPKVGHWRPFPAVAVRFRARVPPFTRHVAQMAEQRAHNPRVGGSSPSMSTNLNASVAQRAEQSPSTEIRHWDAKRWRAKSGSRLVAIFFVVAGLRRTKIAAKMRPNAPQALS